MTIAACGGGGRLNNSPHPPIGPVGRENSSLCRPVSDLFFHPLVQTIPVFRGIGRRRLEPRLGGWPEEKGRLGGAE